MNHTQSTNLTIGFKPFLDQMWQWMWTDNIVTGMMANLDKFVLDPAPEGTLVKCRITRDMKGMDRGDGYTIK